MGRREYTRARIRAGVPIRLAERLYEIEQDAPRGRIEVRAADDSEDVAEIRIYEEIGLDWWTGEGMTPARMAEALDEIAGREVLVRINSPGGNVFDGVAIYNLLAERRERVTVRVDGIAASAASIVAMAGDKIEAAGNAQIMVHNAWTVAIGNAQEMRDVADILERIDSQIADTYSARSGTPVEQIRSLMDAESYLTAQDAADVGLVDEVLPLKSQPDEPSGDPESRAARPSVAAALRVQRAALARAAWRRRTEG